MTRLIGAIVRAIIVVLVFAAPAFLAPGASRSAQEVSVIVGGLVAIFIFFEYVTTQPGLIDFRFAPPYNRVRFAVFTGVLLLITFYARARTGADSFSFELLARTNQISSLLDFPFSPVALAVGMLGDGAIGLRQTVADAAALGFVAAFAGAVIFALMLWVFRWPRDRAHFNLWENVPTFEPSAGRDVERRLKRNGKLLVLAGLAAPFVLLVVASRSTSWFDPSALQRELPLIWATTIWSAGPALIILRGAALWRIALLIERARRG